MTFERNPPPSSALPAAGQYRPLPGPRGTSKERTINIVLLLGSGLAFLLLIVTSITDLVTRQNLDLQSNLQTTHASKTATARVATATANVGEAYPAYLPGQGTLSLSDSLQQAKYWQPNENQSFGGSCQFKEGAFHIRQEKTSRFYSCYDSSASSFSNFALEVQVTIVQGDCGALTFRDDTNGKLYYFEVCQDGTYKVVKYLDLMGKNTFTFVTSRPQAAIKRGPNQMNLLAVYANGNMLRIFVNKQQIAVVQDGEFAQGTFSLAVDSYTNVTDAAFQQVNVWTFS